MESWSVAGIEGLAAKATRKSTCREIHPQTIDEKVEKARAEAERLSAASTVFFVDEIARLSARRQTNLLTVEQRAKKAVANATRYW